VADLLNMNNAISGFTKCEYLLCHEINFSASEDVICSLQQVNDVDG
jgi:hypothetical protein